MVAVIVIVLDQLTKWWALRTLDDRTIHLVGSLRLALTFNKAGAFGLGSSFVPVLALVAVGVVLVVVVRGETNTRFAVAIAIAPPDPPSPTISATIGTRSARHSWVERAIASA